MGRQAQETDMQVQSVEVGRAGLPATANLIDIAPQLALPGFTVTYDPNEEIFGEEEDADFVYKVISGAVRTTRLLTDGRRQIGAFYMAGDVFGLEAGPAHRFSAEAIAPTEIGLVRRSALERAAENDSQAARQLRAITSHELEDLQDHMLLMGRKNAAERVGSFLLKLARRASSAIVELPMSRGDIADHLGLTLETVSRTFSQFVRDQVIGLPSARCVVLRNPAALAAT